MSECIDGYIITIMDNASSRQAADQCIRSIWSTGSHIDASLFRATWPETAITDIQKYLSRYKKQFLNADDTPRWTYPLIGEGIDMRTGLHLKAYRAADIRKVVSCSISHMRLWAKCVDHDRPIMILEHDAVFKNKFHWKKVRTNTLKIADATRSPSDLEFTKGILGINAPFGATRKASNYHNGIIKTGVQPVPVVDGPLEPPMPSGLAGNSAYIIYPHAAKALLEKTAEIGIWPNDALMCRQFFPWLYQHYPYFTGLTPVQSTTTR